MRNQLTGLKALIDTQQAQIDNQQSQLHDQQLAIADLQAAAKNFKDGLGTQSGGKGDTGKAFQALDAKIGEVAAACRDFQYAADTVWPAGIPANAPIRAEFKLPADCSLK
jgi:hypothetical protein